MTKLNTRGQVRTDVVILLVVLLLFFGVGPWWPYSHGWGYLPGGFFGLVFLILLIRLLI